MNTPPPDLYIALLAQTLEENWGISAPTLTYQALGFGSHHWRAESDTGDQ